MSVSRPFIPFIKTKVLQQDLKGLIPDTTKINPVARQMSSAVIALTNAHIRTDKANEAQREEKDEDKTIESVYTGSRLVMLGNVCHAPPGAKLEDVLPCVYSLIANKPKQSTPLSIFQQDAEDIGLTMRIKVPILPLAVGTDIKSLRFGGIDVSNLGSGIGPMAFVPPGADSAKAKTAQLAILEALQSAEFAAGNMSVSDSVALSKTEGYLAEDFTEGEVQIKSFTPVLASAIVPEHPLVAKYIASRDYIETNKIRFYKALTKACGQRQAPAMLVYLFQHLVIGFFSEAATSPTLITPHRGKYRSN